jgi:hypothetical protein
MAQGEKGKGKMHAPGTLVIAFIFLAWFVVFYIFQWGLLASKWPIR